MAIKEELIKATETFDAIKILTEATMTTREIAQALDTTPQNIDRAIKNGMNKMYVDVKKQFKANPAQIMLMLMDYFNAGPEEVMQYLPAEKRAEIEKYVRANPDELARSEESGYSPRDKNTYEKRSMVRNFG